MSRYKRNFRDSSYYHIVNRGVEKRKVFENSFDYLKFMQLIEVGCEKYGVEIIAFSLMPNHYHIIIRSKKGKDVSQWAKWLQGVYAQWFNITHKRTGYLWQNRFFSKEVGGGEHLAKTWMYVDQNPVKARLSKSPEKWRWSSAYLRSHKIQMVYLTEPDWWWTNLKRKWWSNKILDKESLSKVRSSLRGTAEVEFEDLWEVENEVQI